VIVVVVGLLLVLLVGVLIHPDDQKQPTGASPTAQPAGV
jgi:hypothetical protein